MKSQLEINELIRVNSKHLWHGSSLTKQEEYGYLHKHLNTGICLNYLDISQKKE